MGPVFWGVAIPWGIVPYWVSPEAIWVKDFTRWKDRTLYNKGEDREMIMTDPKPIKDFSLCH